MPSAKGTPLERATRQLLTVPSGLTRTITPTLPRRSPVEARLSYSLFGIFEIRRAGVKPEKSPPPPGPLPAPPAPVPLPDRAAPERVALPEPAIGAAGSGEGVGSFGSGATTGVGSADFADAPSGFFIALGSLTFLGGGSTGGGGGTERMSMVVICSTARRTISTLRPDRMR